MCWFIGFAGCEKEKPPPRLVLPEVTGWHPAPREVAVTHPGETFSFRAELRWPGGVNPGIRVRTSFEVNSLPGTEEWSNQELSSIRVRHEPDAVFLDIVPRWLGLQSAVAWLEFCTQPEDPDDRECATVQPDWGWVYVAGGEPRWLSVPVSRTDLLVGERRPFQAVTWARIPNEDQGLDPLTRSHGAVSYSVDDPSVASVDEAGVLIGLAPGATVLRCRAGEQEETVEVVVREGVGAPPGPGQYPVTSLATVHEDAPIRLGSDVHEVMVLEGDGSPRFVLGLRGPQAAAPVATYLVRWTGSGFGFELVEPWWQIRNTWGGTGTVFPALASDGHEYIVWPYAVMDRPAGTTVGGWRTRWLPIRPDLAVGEEDSVAWRFASVPTEWVFPKVVTHPGLDGSLWVAYSYGYSVELAGFSPGSVAGHERDCVGGIRLARVTPESLEVEEVEKTVLEDGVYCSEYSMFDIMLPYSLKLVSPEPGEEAPRVLALDAPGGYWVHHTGQGGWLRKRDGRWEEETLPAVACSPAMSLFDGSTWQALGQEPPPFGAPSWMELAYENSCSGPVEEVAVERRFPPLAAPRVFAYSQHGYSPYRGYTGTRFAFPGFGDRTYVGFSGAGPLWMLRPGWLQVDDPIAAVFPGPDTLDYHHHPVAGYAADGRYFYALSDSDPLDGVTGLALGVAALPIGSTPDTADEQGQLITDALRFLPSSPFLLPASGGRYLEGDLDTEEGQVITLLRSTGQAQAWEVQAPVEFAYRGGQASTWFDGDVLWRVQHAFDGVAITVHRSPDFGATWYLAADTQVDAKLRGALRADFGDLWILGVTPEFQNHRVRLLHAPPPAAQVPAFVELDWPEDPELFISGGEWEAGLFHDHGEVVSVVQAFGRSTFAPSLSVQRRLADGQLLGSQVVPMPDVERCYPRRGGMGAGGRLVIPCWMKDGHAHLPEGWAFYVSEDGGESFTAVRIPLPGWQFGSILQARHIVRLADDRLLLVGTRDVGDDRFIGVYSVSSDGYVWSEPRLVRPEGGGMQWIFDATPLSGGDALLLLGESLGARAGVLGDVGMDTYGDELQWLALRITP